MEIKHHFLLTIFKLHCLIKFTSWLTEPLIDFHVIYRLPFLIYTLFTGSLFRFTCYLQAPVFIFHVIYSLPFFYLHVVYSLPFLFTCYLQYYGSLPVLNLHVIYGFPGWITRNLQAICSICRNSLHVIYMILALSFETFSVFFPHLHVSLEIFTCFLHETSKTCKRGKIM